MKGLSTSPVRRNDAFHRYLKPGALAQIRNTRLNSRSNYSLLTLSLPDQTLLSSSDSQVADAATPTMDQMPDLLNKVYGPFRIGRKKLGPARSVLRTMMDLNPSQSSTIDNTSNGNNNVLSIVDVLVAH